MRTDLQDVASFSRDGMALKDLIRERCMFNELMVVPRRIHRDKDERGDVPTHLLGIEDRMVTSYNSPFFELAKTLADRREGESNRFGEIIPPRSPFLLERFQELNIDVIEHGINGCGARGALLYKEICLLHLTK